MLSSSSFCSMKSYLQIPQNIHLLHSVTTLKSCENKYFKKVLQIKNTLFSSEFENKVSIRCGNEKSGFPKFGKPHGYW